MQELLSIVFMTPVRFCSDICSVTNRQGKTDFNFLEEAELQFESKKKIIYCALPAGFALVLHFQLTSHMV